jgi:hypothetical protein
MKGDTNNPSGFVVSNETKLTRFPFSTHLIKLFEEHFNILHTSSYVLSSTK